MKLIYPHEFKVKNRLITSKSFVKFGGSSGSLYFHETEISAGENAVSRNYIPSPDTESNTMPRHICTGGVWIIV